mgnify:CR=1 FL=1
MACIALAVLRVWRKKITTRIDGIRKLALGPEIDKSSNLESALESLEVELSPEGFERPVLVELGWYGASIDAFPLGIIFADTTGKIVHRNPASLSFFNEYEKIINETLTELIEVSLSGVQLIRELNLDQATDKKAKFIWCQEEPKNMGAWNTVRNYIDRTLEMINFKDINVKYVGRKASSSTATGNANKHLAQQKEILEKILKD